MVINTGTLLNREGYYGYHSHLKIRMEVSGSLVTRNATELLVSNEIWNANWYMSFRVIQEASICTKFPSDITIGF